MKKHLLLLIGSFIMTATANAMHEVRPAYLQIIQIDETSYEIYWKVPSMGTAIPKINPVFGNNFTVEFGPLRRWKLTYRRNVKNDSNGAAAFV